MHQLFTNGFLSYIFIPIIVIAVVGGIIGLRRGISISRTAQMHHHPLLSQSRGLIILGILFVCIGLCIFFAILGFHFYFLGTLIDIWTAGFILVNALATFILILPVFLSSRRNI